MKKGSAPTSSSSSKSGNSRSTTLPPSSKGGCSIAYSRRERSSIDDRQPFCKFCRRKDHLPSKCIAYETIEERKICCDELNLCRYCLRSGHQTKFCKKPATCIGCKGEHHIAFFLRSKSWSEQPLLLIHRVKMIQNPNQNSTQKAR